MQTSSFSEKLLQAEKDCKCQTERANYLENEGNILKKKVEDLEQKIKKTEKESEVLKCKEAKDAACCQVKLMEDNEVRIWIGANIRI